ncbi:MAG: gliding motility-associated C-terminal domain-containing protein [Saprospiraceae bacterium]|nr:gliding motility-associated C-terminal domain-containing protein [Saprospiraceae bacterium]
MHTIKRSILGILTVLISTGIARAAIDLDPIPDQISCMYYVLPPIGGMDLSGNEAYYSGHSGTGNMYAPGDTIFNSTVIYAFDQLGVESDEECFYLQIINNLPDLATIEDDTACQYYILPYFTTPSVSGFAGYYTAPQASGVRFQQGDTLFYSESLFVYDGYDNCFVEKEIHITIDTLPVFDDIPDQYGCNSYELVSFPGEHVLEDQVFFTQGPQTYQVGDMINESQTMTINTTNGVCRSEQEFEVIIVDHLDLGTKQDTFICGPGFTLPEISGPLVSSFARYYRLPAGQGTSYEAGDHHNAINYPVLYIYDNIPGTACVDETVWNIHYTPRPQAYRDFTVTVCRGYSYNVDTLLLRRNTPKHGNRIIPTETNPLLLTDTVFQTGSYPVGEYQFYIIDTTGFPCIPDTAIMTVITTDDCTNPDFIETYCTHPQNDNVLFHLAVNLEKDPAFCLGGYFVEIAGNPFRQWDEHVFIDSRTPDTLVYYYILTDPSGKRDTALITIRIQDVIQIQTERVGPDTLCKGECTSFRIHFLDDDPYFALWQTGSAEDISVLNWLMLSENFTRSNILQVCFLNGRKNLSNENQDTIFLPVGKHSYEHTLLLSTDKECQTTYDTIFQLTTREEATFYYQEIYCAGSVVDLFGETFSETRPEGEIKLDIPAVSGCDSFIYVTLSFYTPAIALYNQDVCYDDTIIINCIPYTHAFPHDTQYLPGLGMFGCDSIIVVNLNFSTLEEAYIDTTICEGDVFNFAGLAFDTPGIHTGVIQSLQLCDSLLYTIELSVAPPPLVEIELSRPLCNDNTASLSVLDNFDEILWSTQASTAQIEIAQPGEYSVTVTDENNCTQTSSITVTQSDDFYISGDHQYTSTLGQPVQFNLIPIGALDSISWMQSAGLDCDNCLNPIATLNASQTFDYIAIDLNGCEVTGTVVVLIEENKAYYIPNVFNPQAELSDNSVFSVFTASPSKAYTMSIYDRWGNIVFHQEDLQTNLTSGGWNGRSRGKLVQSGVYAYRVVIEGLTDPISGTVTVIY